VAVVQGDLTAAEKAYAEAVALGSKDADVYNNLATIYDKWGVKEEEEIGLLTRAWELSPENKEIRKNLLSLLRKRTVALAKDGKYREALSICLLKAELEPESGQEQRELGNCYARTGDLQTAIKHYSRAINLEPNISAHYNDLGLACYELRLLSEAKGAFQEVLRLAPQSVVAYTHLGLLANLAGVSGVAVNMLRRAVDIDPNCAEAQNNLALILRDQGDQTACRHHYEQALRLRPGNGDIVSSYLLSLNDDPKADPAWVASEHRRFQGTISKPVRAVIPRDRNPSRKLRIGYVSSDLRVHSVGFFIAPLVRNHDPDEVEVTCYSTGNVEDEISEQIKAACARYRNVYRVGDDDLADIIKEDGVDVLLELSGHTAGNRLSLCGNRAAPVQMTYLGYPNTTGLSEMDYRITDAIADPIGQTEAWHSEKLLRVEGGFLAYQPWEMGTATPAAMLPAREAGHITFGSFNNLAKINDVVLDTWAAILERVPESTVFLKARGLRDDRVKERILAAFSARGVVGENRVRLMGHERSSLNHLNLYKQMDLALDTFPYNGTTTTCEALWMGTPVVTFAGNSHAGRVGASLLTHAGLPQLVARDRKDYIDRAVELGKDWDVLTELRSGLRERFARSPVMDPVRLARGLESAYRDAWKAYCESTT
jgi:protein O-GlcNAc transferase